MKSMDGIVASLLALAGGFALWAATTAVAVTRPAMWVVRAPEGTVCLFGTVRWLPTRVDGRSRQVSYALEFSENPSIRIELTDGREVTWRLGR